MNINLIILRCYIETVPFFDDIDSSQEYDMNTVGLSYIRTVRIALETPNRAARDMLLKEEKWFLYRRF